jgi:hypothetical protein
MLWSTLSLGARSVDGHPRGGDLGWCMSHDGVRSSTRGSSLFAHRLSLTLLHHNALRIVVVLVYFAHNISIVRNGAPAL